MATTVIGTAIGIVVGVVGALLTLRFQAGSRLAAARRTRQVMLAEARREADALRREAELEGKEEAVRVRDVPLTEGRTVYDRIGDVPAWAAIVTFAAAMFVGWRRGR